MLNLIIKRFNHHWVQPIGYNTGIKVYNCVANTKVPLIVRDKHLVTWYTCGPTVYDDAHIGHACCYVKLDIVQRILRDYFNLNLVTAINITDIDDKIIARCKETGRQDVAAVYERQFHQDCRTLGLIEPHFVLRVTEHIDAMRQFIRKLVREKVAYQGRDRSVYFDVSRYKLYGKLRRKGQEDGVDESPLVDGLNEYKRNPRDFALWKSTKNKGRDGTVSDEPSWDSDWGPGRPGWHIECSALGTYAFGSCIDIHAGGYDLQFPHHENEEAQSCMYHNNYQWVNYWLHTGLLNLKDSSDKMSKSLKNTITIKQFFSDTDPMIFRMACCMSHYRSSMEFSDEYMMTARNVLQNFRNFTGNCRDYANGYIKATLNADVLNKLLGDAWRDLDEALKDDFNTPLVVGILNRVLNTTNQVLLTSSNTGGDNQGSSPQIVALLNYVVKTLKLFGIELNQVGRSDSQSGKEHSDFIQVMDILNAFRQEIRQLGISGHNQNLLTLCDRVRTDLKGSGVNVKDFGKLSSWSHA